MPMDPVIAASAHKHGISDNDILHTYRHPIRVFQMDDLVMLIGGNESGRMLEVGVVAAEGIEFIIPPCLPARSS